MPLPLTLTLDVIEALENFIDKRRPPENIRHQLDLSYKTEDQSVFIYEVRPAWDNPAIIREHPFAKATFIKAKDHWKIFWMRSDLKWHAYPPKPTVKTILEFIEQVDKDEHACFWG